MKSSEWSTCRWGRRGRILNESQDSFTRWTDSRFRLESYSRLLSGTGAKARGRTNSGAGTSLAAPLVARSAAELLARCPDIGTLATRAILIDGAEKESGADADAKEHGFLDVTTEALKSCTKTSVSVVYEGVLSPRKTYWRPFLLPPSYVANGRSYFSWTVVLLPEVDGSAHDEYCVCGLELRGELPAGIAISTPLPRPALPGVANRPVLTSRSASASRFVIPGTHRKQPANCAVLRAKR
jgi:hypothetical protein